MRPSGVLLVGKLPTRWLKAVEALAPSTIYLHPSLGGDESKRNQRYAAWKGDKLLGAAAVKVLDKTCKDGTNRMLMEASSLPEEHELSAGAVSLLTGTAFSNSFLAANVQHILPVAYAQQDKREKLNDHQVATMIEAAVANVHDRDEADDAVLDLVEWLLEKASNHNTKGAVLELGGVVTCTQIGGFDHSPVFQATATLECHSAVATASAKKKAEQLAARRLLEEMDIDDYSTLEESSLSTVLSLEDQTRFGEWHKDGMDTMRLKLSGESLEDWWLRGALDPKKSFHRAMMAPLVFPECIVAVDSWTRASPPEDITGELAAAFIIVTSRNGKSKQDVDLQYYVTSICQGSSNTRARIKMSLEANQTIAEIAAIELSEAGSSD